jgi:chloride channel protein, CIC family
MKTGRWFRLNHPLLRKYTRLVHEDLSQTYSRDLHKWLFIAPTIGVTTGLICTLIVRIILVWLWPRLRHLYFVHPVAIIPGLVIGFVIAGLIMQYFARDPDEHSTEEIIQSYHEHQGDIDMRAYLPKLIAAIATVGFGGSAALEGPSIYGGGGLGSWLWAKLRRFHLEPRDRRIMLMSGAAAGMAAVFRAPLTGLVFALEMPYKDDLAHEALLPSLISSVVAYAVLVSFVGAKPLFDFVGVNTYSRQDLLWAALLGVFSGLFVMAFDITFRRVRTFMVRLTIPHWLKMAIGGALTGVCGLVFIWLFHPDIMPLGPNYRAVARILQSHYSSFELVVFGLLKLAGTICSLGVGGVSAMFVPLFLSGGSFGAAFAQSVVRTPAVDLFGAVGMAAFIAAGYKTPLTAVIFVAEATGGHAYIVPALIGAAVAYAVSGEASVSGDQRLHESVKVQELWRVHVREIMQKQVISTDASSSLRDFIDKVALHHRHTAFPVYENGRLLGTIPLWSVGKVSPQKWAQTPVRDLTDRSVITVEPDCDLTEALRLLMSERAQHMLLVTCGEGKLEGILTKADILSALNHRDSNGHSTSV